MIKTNMESTLKNVNIILENACSGMFSDELDKMGYRKQVVTRWFVNQSTARIYGPARTVRIQTVEGQDENIRLGLGFLGTLDVGDILVIEGSKSFAYFGELMTRLSIRQGIGGVVIDGLTRDNLYTQNEKNLCIFARGYSPVDIKGRGCVAAVDIPVRFGDCRASVGDWVFGDADGVVIIPKDIKFILERCVLNVIDGEKSIIKDINSNLSIEDILNRYKEF